MHLLITLLDSLQTSVSVKRINKFMNADELDPNDVQHDEKECELRLMEMFGEVPY